jgi:hypothetical protein
MIKGTERLRTGSMKTDGRFPDVAGPYGIAPIDAPESFWTALERGLDTEPALVHIRSILERLDAEGTRS